MRRIRSVNMAAVQREEREKACPSNFISKSMKWESAVRVCKRGQNIVSPESATYKDAKVSTLSGSKDVLQFRNAELEIPVIGGREKTDSKWG